MFRRKNVHYVSKIDQMLDEFDEKQGKSPAQKAEINKYARLNQLRDVKNINDAGKSS